MSLFCRIRCHITTDFGAMALESRDCMIWCWYANILGVSYETVVSGFIKACIFRQLLGDIMAYRRRTEIAVVECAPAQTTLQNDRSLVLQPNKSGPAHPAK
jgi:hypothetical protein